MTLDFMKDQRKMKSEFLYDTKGGSNYLKASSNSSGITDEQLIFNLEPRLSEHIKKVPPLN